MLRLLVQKPGRVFTRDDLLIKVWGDANDSFDRTVDAHIKTLRAKLKLIAPGLEPIRTLRGSGYRIRNERLEVQADQARWRCFVAERMGRTILRPAPGDWATNVRTGPMQIDVGVAALIQWGTTPWIAR